MSLVRDELRWNGWGRVSESFAPSEQRAAWLLGELGQRLGRPLGARQTPVGLDSVRLPPAALAPQVIVSLREACGEDAVRNDHVARTLYAMGRSLPDLLRLRSGELPLAPDAVVSPGDEAAVVSARMLGSQMRVLAEHPSRALLVVRLEEDGGEYWGTSTLLGQDPMTIEAVRVQ